MADPYDPNAADDPNALGAVLTGTPATPPVQNILAPAPQLATGGGFLDDPRDRAALLQIGLNLMQPQAIGQSFGGHLAQAVGSGGEAVDRRDTADLKAAAAESKMQIADEKLRIAQQNADTRERKGLGGAIKGLTESQRLTQERADRREERQSKLDEEKRTRSDAEELAALAAKTDLADPEDPNVKKLAKYRNKTTNEIIAMQRAEREGVSAARPAGASATAKDSSGRTIYAVGGQWVDAQGVPIK